MHIPQNFLPRSRQKLLRSAPGQSFPAVAVMPLAAKVLKKVMVNTGGNKRQVPAKRRKRLVRTVLIFTESSDQLSRATDRVPGLPASPGYVQ
ncbi:hypothetical protein OFO42_21935 [Escherichia coli]|nr:hypothetical protein [Escherichia coli]MCV4854395.1 hypothetical protein [Escherichia coli]